MSIVKNDLQPSYKIDFTTPYQLSESTSSFCFFNFNKKQSYVQLSITKALIMHQPVIQNH